ncbi:MAG: hypothetical protein V4727_00130 [Verrucomicrobiota bacterium]
MSQFSGGEYAQLGQPQQVKVFGIMHLIFGGYGVLVLVWSLFVIIAGNPFHKLAGNTPEMQVQAKLETDMVGFTIAGTALHFVVTVLIIIAGILLLKGRKSARKWSNYYAWSSIATKIYSLIFTLIVVVPMTQEMMKGTTSGAAAMKGGFEAIMIGSMLVGLLLPLIYPVLSLILLNRPYVKTWFSNQPD